MYGIVKREAFEDEEHRLRNIIHIKDRINLHPGSTDDHLSLYKIFKEVLPDECYHLSAASFVSYKLDDEFMLMNYNFSSTHYLLSIIKEAKPQCRFFFAGSSEMFGESDLSPQTEETKFNPKTIYGISKAASFYLVKNYREKEGIYACTGIMYNHESPRRGYQYITRKVAHSAAQIKVGYLNKLTIGNLEAQRDWGYAPDFVLGMWKMLQGKAPDDYILATGKLRSVRDLIETAFSMVGMDYGQYIKIDQKYFRPSEKISLCGDPSKIQKDLKWENKKDFKEMISEMVEHELKILCNENIKN